MTIPASGWRKLYLTVWVCVIIGFSLTACGNRVPPPGGPVDDFPPTIVSIEPESNLVNVDPDAVIRIEFDEEILPSRGRRFVQIQPRQRDLQEKVRGKSIEVRARDGFSLDCTLCVGLSPEIVDLRGNRLEKPVEFCFSTGGSIDRGIVTGTITFPDSLKGSGLFQATCLPDSLLYTTPLGEDGTFRLSHLPRGSYHFIAYIDRNGDGQYEPLSDPRVERLGEVGDEEVVIELEWPGTTGNEDESID